MPEGVLNTLIGGVVAVLVAIVGAAGVWLGRKPTTETPPPKRRKADRDPLADVLTAMQADQMQWREEVRRDLRKDLADARAEFALERQRHSEEMWTLRDDMAREREQYEGEIARLRAEIAGLRARIRELEGHA